MPNVIEYIHLSTIEDLNKVIDLQRIIWGMDDIDLTPIHYLRMNLRNGGIVLGAKDGDEIVGFVIGLPARKYGEWVIWSDIAGVSPAYQGQGIGKQLKLIQRDWAIENGYKQIRWTFDPLQRRNANFNLNVLRAIGDVYEENVYGEIHDSLNAGMKTDRLEAAWNLLDEHLSTIPSPISINDGRFILAYREGELITAEISDEDHLYFVEIPFDLVAHKKNNMKQLQEWQMTLRQTLQQAFAASYVADQFVVENDRCWYVLRPK